MADVKITGMPPAVPLTGAELAELVQSGGSVKATATAIANTFDITVPVDQGGTGRALYEAGNLLYADTTTTLDVVPPSPVRGAALLAGADATFTGSIASTTLTIAPGVLGNVVPDMVVTGAGVTAGTVIINQLTGTPGKNGTYTVSVSQTVGSVPMAAATATTVPTYGVLTAPGGGTGFASYTVGNLLYAATTTSLAKVEPSPVAGAALIAGATASFTGSIASTTLTVAPGVVGNVVPNMVVAGAGVTAGTVILAQLTGTPGKNGTYSIDISQTVGSVAMTATAPTNTPAWGVVSVAGGGTGVSTLTGYVKAAGTAPMTASATIPFADMAGRAYLQAYSLLDQTGNPAAATAIQFEVTDAGFSQGISMTVDGAAKLTRIRFAVAGVYEVAPNIQFANSVAADHDVTIWLRQNGTNVPNSATILTIPKVGDGGVGFFQIVFLVKTTAVDEYVEVMWLPENIAVTADFTAAGPIAPAIPSALVYAERVS